MRMVYSGRHICYNKQKMLWAALKMYEDVLLCVEICHSGYSKRKSVHRI